MLSQSGLTDTTSVANYTSDTLVGKAFVNTPYTRLTGSSAQAKLWENRWQTWQHRELQKRQDAVKLEADQLRLFGGEPGDDVSLCYKMLEYFGGLDYIDT